MGHRAEKQAFGSMKNMRRIATNSKVGVGELKSAFCRWQPPKIGKPREGDARLSAPRFWKPRHVS